MTWQKGIGLEEKWAFPPQAERIYSLVFYRGQYGEAQGDGGNKDKAEKGEGPKEDQNVAEKRDCLAELPEPLLHHILSCLTMKDVIRTSVLAKRWRYIWLYVPCLTFSPLKKTKAEEEAFITRSLILHKGPQVQKLNITFTYSTEALLIDSWIQFALSRNVNQLYLDFRSRYYSTAFKTRIHDIVFSCSSLTELTLKGCRIELPVKIKLGSLKTLSFEEVKVRGAVNNLLASCPILEDLSFADCYLKRNHVLVIGNSSVKTLKIEGGYLSGNLTLEIHAPFIVSIELIIELSSESYIIKRMESLCSARSVCSKSGACHEQGDTIFSNLEYLRHVKDLGMCSCYIQAMSSIENPTQDCREKHIMDFISFEVTCLRIKTGLMKWELPGIAYILSHSPNVETLIISIDEILDDQIEDNFQEEEYWKLQEPKFVNLLCNLKDVKIYNFMKNLSLLESKQNNMNFLRFLLKNSMVLERMTTTVNFRRNSKNKKS
ncbi:hypothetical protein RHGRI_017789 [Rhododendron griersonianum]|uniref:F-box domain-containing protein n=1 Tax=Rhododendron griersonianum TaxID=479676 RepID=A0AAV6JZ20_9ERIC|nr:hypothetical protein RHGRI_017789 [Rhododendron griersonianum]